MICSIGSKMINNHHIMLSFLKFFLIYLFLKLRHTHSNCISSGANSQNVRNDMQFVSQLTNILSTKFLSFWLKQWFSWNLFCRGTDFMLLPRSPEFIVSSEPFEPMYIPKQTILEESLRREIERICFADTLINRVVFDCVD